MASPVIYAMPDLIQDRLEAMLPTLHESEGTIPVWRASSVEQMPKNAVMAVVVIPVGLEVSEQRRNQVAIAESIIVVVQVRNPSSQRAGITVLQEAGPLLAACVTALLGWSPDGDAYEPLTMVSAPSPEFEAGFGYYPLAFQTRYVLSGVSV